jgi:4-carboxymuconolactone decarboxylase
VWRANQGLGKTPFQFLCGTSRWLGAISRQANSPRHGAQMKEQKMPTEQDMATAMALFKRWSSKAMDEMAAELSPDFGGEMARLSFENVFTALWGRPGLDLRSRSLVTLGILIALRAQDELMVHFPIAIANGLTVQEVEEVLYHSTAYAGFPAASLARRTATITLRKQGLIDQAAQAKDAL